MKKVAIMQPYFLPYIGYWQLINAVDEFVVYDNIEFTKKGWFNRNRILEIDHDRLFTIPIKKDSDFLTVGERYISDDAAKENARTLRIIQTNYKKAPYYDTVYPLIESCFLYNDKNLFEYIYNSIKAICEYLDINTKITLSSHVTINHGLKAEQKVKAISKTLGADIYINAIGGAKLYNKNEFASHGLELKFLKPELAVYQQYGTSFVPGLSIIDVLMFNDVEHVSEMLKMYTLE